MDIGQAIFLALLQGLTEFLPVSSSAHLILPAQLFGWEDQGLAFDVAVHVGTLVAVLLYFRKDLLVMTGAWVGSALGGRNTEESRLAWLLLLATVPAGVAGLLLNEQIETSMRSILVIAVATLVFGVGLYIAERYGSKDQDMAQLGWRGALLIGLFQALALIPGTSRSGITITAGLLLGLSRTASARFSFLLSIPIILGAGLLKTMELLQLEQVDWFGLALGAVIAFLSAYLAIDWFLKLIDRVGLLPFVIYRLVLGTALLLIAL